MPEGDTIFRTARTLQRAIGGQIVARFESVFPAVTRVADDHPVVGRTIESVQSRGKHLLMVFSGDLTLHTHMRMNGAWHIYRPGERWHRPHVDMRVLVATERMVAVGFNVPVAELLTTRQLSRHPQLGSLGPDLLDEGFDRTAAIARLQSDADRGAGEMLLDQRVMAGVGNVLKSEILFVAAVNPFTAVSSLDATQTARLVDVARDLIQRSVRQPTAGPARGRRTIRSLNPAERFWVYGRAGRPCRRCGSPIQSKKTGPEARMTFWCARCQPGL
jgi:endonuclease VIII